MTTRKHILLLLLAAGCTAQSLDGAESYLAEKGVTVAKSGDGKVVVVAALPTSRQGLERTLDDNSAGKTFAGFGYAPLAEGQPSMTVLSQPVGTAARFRAPWGKLDAVQKETNQYLSSKYRLHGIQQKRLPLTNSNSLVFWMERQQQGSTELVAVETTVAKALAERGEFSLANYANYGGFKLRELFNIEESVDETNKLEKGAKSLILVTGGKEFRFIAGGTDDVEEAMQTYVDLNWVPTNFAYSGSSLSAIWMSKSFTATEDYLRLREAQAAAAAAPATPATTEEGKEKTPPAAPAPTGPVKRQLEYRIEYSESPEEMADNIAPLLADGWQPLKLAYRGNGTVVWLRCGSSLVPVTEDADEPLDERLERIAAAVSAKLATGCRVHQVFSRTNEAVALLVDNALATPPEIPAPAAPVAPRPATVLLHGVKNGKLKSDYTDRARHSDLVGFSYNGTVDDVTSVVLAETNTTEGRRYRFLAGPQSDSIAQSVDKLLARGFRVFDWQYRRTRIGEGVGFYLTSNKGVQWLMEPLTKLNDKLYTVMKNWEISGTFLGPEGNRSFPAIVIVSKDGAWENIPGTAAEVEAGLQKKLEDGYVAKAFGYNPDAAGAAGRAAIWLSRNHGGTTEYRLLSGEEAASVAVDATELMKGGWTAFDAYYGGTGAAAYLNCKGTLRAVVEPRVDDDKARQRDFERRLGESFTEGCDMFRLINRSDRVMSVWRARK